MTRRERVLTALRRQPPDRVPMDLGGTLASTINVHAYRRLMAHLGFGEDAPMAYVSRRANSILPDERLLARLGVDCRAVVLGNPDAAPERELPDGSLTDEWGVTWKHLGAGQHYINTDGPFYRKDPDPAILEEFPWPDPLDPGRLRGVREQAEAHRARTAGSILAEVALLLHHRPDQLGGHVKALCRRAHFRLVEAGESSADDLLKLPLLGDGATL